MPCGLKTFDQVPDGSVLKLWLEPENPSDDTFTALAEFFKRKKAAPPPPKHETLDHDSIVGDEADAKRIPLSIVYDFYALDTITVVFSGSSQSTVTINAEIVKPDGSTFKKPFKCASKGSNGVVALERVLIVME